MCSRPRCSVGTAALTLPSRPAEIRTGNLKSILGLFFILSRYKQQQQQQQQYYQSLVELSQQAAGLKTQDMQSRYPPPPLVSYI